MKNLPTDDLLLSPDLQMRAALDTETISEYAAAMKAGEALNAVALARGRCVVAEIIAVDESPIHVHCRVISSDVSETKRPILPAFIVPMMNALLEHHGCAFSDLEWVSSSHKVGNRAEKKSSNGEIVYFLRAGDFIKIGKATGSPCSRISSLQTGCPFPITELCTVPGGIEKERDLHKRFSGIRAHGEWFHATGELLDFINALADTGKTP